MVSLAWTLCPDIAFSRVGQRRSVQTSADGGFVMRRQVVDRELPKYTLRWANADGGVIRMIEYYWTMSERGVLPILYTPPGEDEIEVRMIGPLTYRMNGTTRATIEIELEAIR